MTNEISTTESTQPSYWNAHVHYSKADVTDSAATDVVRPDDVDTDLARKTPELLRTTEVINKRGGLKMWEWVKAIVGTYNKNHDRSGGTVFRLYAHIPGDAGIIEQVWRYRDRGTTWSDSRGTTYENVDSYVRLSHEITEEELREVFGPQWLELVSLIHIAASLPSDLYTKLPIVLNDAWKTARNVARDVMWYASRDAQWGVSHYAALAATQTAKQAEGRTIALTAAQTTALTSVLDVAAALSARDLIGQYKFTQAHYDTLTEPWRKMVGKIHPDDKDM